MLKFYVTIDLPNIAICAQDLRAFNNPHKYYTRVKIHPNRG